MGYLQEMRGEGILDEYEREIADAIGVDGIIPDKAAAVLRNEIVRRLDDQERTVVWHETVEDAGYDGDCYIWHCACGLEWDCGGEDMTKDDELKYCPKCGAKIREFVKAKPFEDEEEE